MIVCAAATLIACGNPPAGSPEYKQGALGNGGFLFQCGDSVACDRWSDGNAKDFPSQIATGSTFQLRFVAAQDQGDLNADSQQGTTLRPLPPYVSSGPEGFTMLKPGLGTVIARNAAGSVIDYVTLRIVKPDALVVYAAEYKGDSPPPIESLTLASSNRRSLRTVGQWNKQALAGSIHIEWTSSDDNVIGVESYTGGVVTLLAKKAGTATLTAAGAALTKTISVQVTS
jgi:hypothetical protein